MTIQPNRRIPTRRIQARHVAYGVGAAVILIPLAVVTFPVFSVAGILAHAIGAIFGG